VTVKVRFLPDDVTTTAKAGESLLAVAARAGAYISTGCLTGACHACEVEIAGEDMPILACLKAIPPDLEAMEVILLNDPTW
jgi:ferredoxin